MAGAMPVLRRQVAGWSSCTFWYLCTFAFWDFTLYTFRLHVFGFRRGCGEHVLSGEMRLSAVELLSYHFQMILAATI